MSTTPASASIPPEVKCCICTKRVTRPLVCPGSHPFCYDCILLCIHSGNHSCPVCDCDLRNNLSICENLIDIPPSLDTPYWQQGSMNPFTDGRFFPIVANLPEAETRTLAQHADDPTQLPIMVTFNRLSNRICNHCLDKSKVSELKWCGACQMTFYCNETCQANDWGTHKRWCCNPKAEADKGPLAVAVVKIADNQ